MPHETSVVSLALEVAVLLAEPLEKFAGGLGLLLPGV